MELTATTFVSVDGVYQGPGGRSEDTSGGFERGGWLAPHFDEEAGQFVTSVFERADALLLGRRTWQIFESYWPHHDEGDPVSHGINVLPKHVPSTTLKDPGWNTHVIEGDVVQAVRDLKAQPGRELQVHGSGALLRFLLENDLVDRLNLLVFPVIVGSGKRLFPEQGLDTRLVVEEARTTPSGVTMSRYRPAGRPEYAEADADG